MRLALPLLAAAGYLLYRSRSHRRSLPHTLRDGGPRESDALPDDDAASPNAAERLKASHYGGAFSGLGAERGAPAPKLRDTDGTDGITTGLPDLTRGA